MHIPKGASQTCALLTFDDALHCPQHDDYDAARWLYVPPYYTEYRYILGTRGENPLICIGINPSTAQPGDLDNTLKSVERIALGNGYSVTISRSFVGSSSTRKFGLRIKTVQRYKRRFSPPLSL